MQGHGKESQGRPLGGDVFEQTPERSEGVSRELSGGRGAARAKALWSACASERAGITDVVQPADTLSFVLKE